MKNPKKPQQLQITTPQQLYQHLTTLTDPTQPNPQTLITHHTTQDQAQHLTTQGYHKTYNTQIQTPTQIAQTTQHQFKPQHKQQLGSQPTTIIITFPTTIKQKHNLHTIDDINNYLQELHEQNKTPTPNHPPQNILGHIQNQQLKINPQYQNTPINMDIDQ